MLAAHASQERENTTCRLVTTSRSRPRCKAKRAKARLEIKWICTLDRKPCGNPRIADKQQGLEEGPVLLAKELHVKRRVQQVWEEPLPAQATFLNWSTGNRGMHMRLQILIVLFHLCEHDDEEGIP